MLTSRIQWVGWDASRFSYDVRKLAGRGIGAAAIHLVNRIRQLISVPAPRLVVKRKITVPVMKTKKTKFGFKVVRGQRTVTQKYIVAATPAIPGAPPRKLTGKLRQSIAWDWRKKDIVARVGTNIEYAAPLEFGRRTRRGTNIHPFISVALQRAKGELSWIMWNAFNRGSVSGN